MSERSFESAPIPESRYGEMRCRRYLFDRAYGEDAASPPLPASGRLAPDPQSVEWEGGPERPQ